MVLEEATVENQSAIVVVGIELFLDECGRESSDVLCCGRPVRSRLPSRFDKLLELLCNTGERFELFFRDVSLFAARRKPSLSISCLLIVYS
jgi:hypothetical protein